MFFTGKKMPEAEAKAIPPRLLAHVGDAVFHLYERERQLAGAQSVSELHRVTVRRTSAPAQSELLDAIAGILTEAESDVVRRARNIKAQRTHRGDQAAYRRATAFEALIGYLYLTDTARLKEILDSTLL